MPEGAAAGGNHRSAKTVGFAFAGPAARVAFKFALPIHALSLAQLNVLHEFRAHPNHKYNLPVALAIVGVAQHPEEDGLIG